MPRPLRIQFPGAKYHLACRGNARQTIFRGPADCSRFMLQLSEALDRDHVVLFAYCLMPNHYHLFVETPKGNVAAFMHRLNTAYSMYHRYKHARPGNLLQPRYKSPLVEGDEYAFRLVRYIHLNPVKIRRMNGVPAEAKIRHLNAYPWSSYRGYVTKAAEKEIVDYRWRELTAGKTAASTRQRYRRHTESMIDDDDELLIDAMEASRYAIGDDEFVREIEDALRERAASVSVPADVCTPLPEPADIAAIDGIVCDFYGCTPRDLRRHGRAAGEAKTVALELACRHGRRNHRQAGVAYGGMSGAGVGRQRRQLRNRVLEDLAFGKRLCVLQERLLAAVRSHSL